MQAEPTPPKEAEQPAPSAATPAASPYDSNPFTTALTGVRKLLKTNVHTAIATIFFNILLFILAGLSWVAVAFAIITLLFKYAYDSTVQKQPFDFLAGMSDTSLYATIVIGIVIGIFVVTLSQALLLRLSIASSRNISLRFGELVKGGAQIVLPLLGLIGLGIVAFIGLAILLALLGKLLGYITIVLGLIVVVAVIYVSLRLGFAAYSIADEQVGPITAIKRSWALTRGHMVEVIGAAAAGWLFVGIPSLIMAALAAATQSISTVSLTFNILDVVLMVVLVVASSMAISERYVQLRGVDGKQIAPTAISPLNYVAVVAMIAVAFMIGALSPQDKTNSGFPGYNSTNSPYYDDNSAEDLPSSVPTNYY